MRRDYVSSRRCLRCACSEPSGPRGYGLARTPTLRWRSSAKLAPSEPVAHGLVLRSRRSSTRRGPCSSMARPSPGNQPGRNDRERCTPECNIVWMHGSRIRCWHCSPLQARPSATDPRRSLPSVARVSKADINTDAVSPGRTTRGTAHFRRCPTCGFRNRSQALALARVNRWRLRAARQESAAYRPGG